MPSALRDFVVPALVLFGVVAGSAAGSDTAGTERGYRTVVVFGDTQALVDGPNVPGSLAASDPEDAAELQRLDAMVDWVIDHRVSENIDFVLHVGDAIEHGGVPRLPLPDGCRVDGVCRPRSKDAEHPGCRCGWIAATRTEWERFNRAWKRLDGVVPYAIVRGNHDNPGDARLRDAWGFAQYYGAETMSARPGYLESSPGDDVSHAWRFELAGRPILVVGISDSGQPAQLQWARDVITRPEHRDTPVILLAHRFFKGVPVRWDAPHPAWTEVVERHSDRIFMAVWGHVSPGDVRFRRVGTHEILSVRSNWQAFVHRPEGSYLQVIRFHLDDRRETIREVEILAWSPSLGWSVEPGLARARMYRTPFVVPLSGRRDAARERPARP